PEHIGDFANKRIARFKVPVLVDGNRVWRDMAEVDTSSAGAHANWPEHFFAQIVNGYVDVTGQQGGVVGHAHSHLIPARGLLAYAIREMERVASD
ncbi:MAG: hypothetical protein ACRD2A_09475, partial [Vicinamibacterales bacterium]